MPTQEAGPSPVTCSSCGAVLQPDVGEQFFCEDCGAPLTDRAPDAGGLAAGYRGPRRIELRPASSSSPGRITSRGRSTVKRGYLLPVLLALGLACLLGGILAVLLASGWG